LRRAPVNFERNGKRALQKLQSILGDALDENMTSTSIIHNLARPDTSMGRASPSERSPRFIFQTERIDHAGFSNQSLPVNPHEC
jgi:hypothetical protein